MAIVCANLLAHAAIVKTDDTQTHKSTFSIPDNIKVINTSGIGTSDTSTSPRLYAVCATPEKEKGATRADMITIYPELLNGMMSVTAVGSNGAFYYSQINMDTGEQEISLPTGEYDLMGFGFDGQNIIVLSEYNINIQSDSSIRFDGNDACYVTAIQNYSPNGELLSLPSDWGAADGNCFTSTSFIMMLYNDICFTFAPIFSSINSGNEVRSNFLEGPFSIESVTSIVSHDGIMNITVPVDFSKSEVGSTSSGWQSVETSFASTPANELYQNYVGKVENLTNNSYTQCSLLYNGTWLITGSGYIDQNFEYSGKICFWKPEDYSGPFDIGCYPRSTMMFGQSECAILGLPFVSGDSNPVQLGVNYAAEMDLVLNNHSYEYKSVCPYLENFGSKIYLGNCAPALLIFPNQTSFKYNFMGRHGEIFNVDTWYDPWGYQDPEIVSAVGLPASSVKVSFNNELITDNRTEFPNRIDWSREGIYEIEVETNNILINNEVKGTTKGSVTFDTGINDQIIPTVSAFQVVKKDNEEVTDMLDKPENGFLRIFAGDFQSRFNNELYYYYCDVTEVDNVTVEYSPTGLGEYKPLEVTKGDLFITPGFGREYTADLSSIDRLGIGGWFDIRITVEDENYSKHVQEICPALNISSMAGVEAVSVDNDEEVEYFNLQGLRIATPEPGTMVIERKGNKTQKTMIQ